MQDRTIYEEVSRRKYAFYEKLRQRQAELGLTYDDIADKTGIEYDKVGRFMRGDYAKPDIFHAEAVCQLLGVSADMELGNEAHSDSESVSMKKELDLLRELEQTRLRTIDALKLDKKLLIIIAIVSIVLAFTMTVLFFAVDISARETGFIRNGAMTTLGIVIAAIIISVIGGTAVYAIRASRNK